MLPEEIAAFWECVRQARRKYPEWRKGQTFMNALHAVAPELYDDISGTSKDCFYRDDQVFAFRDYLGI